MLILFQCVIHCHNKDSHFLLLSKNQTKYPGCEYSHVTQPMSAGFRVFTVVTGQWSRRVCPIRSRAQPSIITFFTLKHHILKLIKSSLIRKINENSNVFQSKPYLPNFEGLKLHRIHLVFKHYSNMEFFTTTNYLNKALQCLVHKSGTNFI